MTAQPASLTRRQMRVLEMIADGLTNRQIARHLGITEGTVKEQLTAIYLRLGVTNRTEAAVAFVRAQR